MKEKGPLRKTIETAGKVWTIISVPIEAFLLGHGLYTRNKLEIFLGAAGLLGDLFVWKWLNRDKKNQLKNTPPSQLVQEKGSLRAFNTSSPRLASVA